MKGKCCFVSTKQHTGKMQKIILFEGNNEDEFFVEVNKIISNIEKRKKIEEIDVERAKICLGECYGTIYSDMRKLIFSADEKKKISTVKQLNKFLDESQERNFQYILHVNNEGESVFDVIPLRLFILLRKKYDNKIYLYLDENEPSNINRIAAYMFIENLKGMSSWESVWEKNYSQNKEKYRIRIKPESFNKNVLYNQVYYTAKDNNRLSRLPIHGMGSLNRILPCIYLDWEWQKLFSDSVEMHYKNFNMREEIYRNNLPVSNDYIYKIQKELMQSGKNEWILQETYTNSLSETQWKRMLYEVIIKDICIDNLLDSQLLNKENAGKIFELCKNMSMLSLLLFSSFCHFIYESTEKELKKTEINNLYQAAQDFAEGLFQLMENALDYSEGSCFSFRIHSGSNDYLERNYSNIIIDKDTYYLEVLLSDINDGDNIPEKFVKNLRNRVQENELSEDLVVAIANEITLEGFFKPNKEMEELWDEYYMIAENVTNHYGLQLFNTLVNYYQGYFAVSSMKSENDNSEPFYQNYGENRRGKEPKLKKGYPGTQYSILLPIKRQEEQKRVGINIYPAFDDIALKNSWKNQRISVEELFEGVQKIYDANNRENKKNNIRKIVNNCELFYKNKTIFVIDLKSSTYMIQVELLAKAMISFILHHQGEHLRIALINSSHSFLVEFTRFFAVFYNKNANCTAMKKTQLFLCDGECRTEITFAGSSLKATYAGNELWANAKGEYNQCLEMLQIILSQRTKNVAVRKKKVEVVPFELLIMENGITLFEKRVYHDLMNDIQKEEFGCLLNDIHMRVGSKMHVTDHFFETFQLFNSSFYNSRFAFLLANKIQRQLASKRNSKKSNNLILVGYDTYSELLMLETQKLLKQLYKISAKCIIYEQMPHPQFRMWKDDMADGEFVIIVPTSTTLTTHGKIIVELSSKIGHDISSSILLNIALILIRDSSELEVDGELADGTILEKNISNIEKNYWYAIETCKRNVRTKTTKPENISYNVLIESKWQEPLLCKSCYPSDSLLMEKPIIEVNRASVVPMIMAGPKESSLKKQEENFSSDKNINLLREVMYYGHIKRKNNHFQYYFKTDELMNNILDDYDNKQQFISWLSEVKKKVLEQRKEQEEAINKKFHQTPYIYNILVAPIHETNASFLEQINTVIFEDVPIVLYIDSDREYRENILSKYSNLTALYNNILHTGRRAIINFHYIDDSINSGVAFRRTHSLLQSLFPKQVYEQGAQVQVNLFQNIIILLNRNSKSTIQSFACTGAFFSYINLQISGLRNHHDNACALCSELSADRKLKERSSINSMALYWENIINNKEVKITENIVKKEGKQERYFRRLLCTHEINQHLSNMGWNRNETTEVRTELIQIILNRLNKERLSNSEKMEYVMAYFVVLSRPYLSYRKSVLDVIFTLLLEVLDGVLNNGISKELPEGELVNLICENFFQEESTRKKVDFVKVMIDSISRLGACYLIRLEVMNKLFALAKKIEFSENEFELLYGAAIKRLITLGKDESIGLWLEYLILTEGEYGKKKEFHLKVSQNFKDLLFYENTYIIADAVEELVYKQVASMDDIDEYFNEYYFDNFKKLMHIDYMGFLPEVVKPDDLNWGKIKQILLGMVKMKKHLAMEDKDRETDNYYRTLLTYVQEISDARYVCIYGIDSNNQIYIISSTIKDYYSTSYFCDIEKDRKKGEKESNYLEDSVYFYAKNQAILCLMEKNEKKKEENSNGENLNGVKNNINTDSVWLMLEFYSEENSTEKMVCNENKFAIRNILVYRYLLSERLKDDFRKDTFSRIKELSLKNELLSTPKVGTHTPEEVLIRIEDKLEHINATDKNIFDWAGTLLQMASDSLISRLYVEAIIQGTAKLEEREYNEEEIKKKLSFEEFTFSKEIQKLLKQMSFVNKNKTMPTYADIHVEESAKKFKFLFPAERRYYNLLIIAAIVQNAVKHGKAEETEKQEETGKEKVKVTIKIKDKYLIIENMLKKGSETKEQDDKEGNNGITIPALKYYFNKYYHEEMITKNSNGAYEVKMPVVVNLNLEEENEKCKKE